MKKYLIIVVVSTLFLGCSDYLELKPDQKMVIPETLEDSELLLNDYPTMNSGFPIMGEVSADNYYLTTTSWQSVSLIDERNGYIWSDEMVTTATPWQTSYKAIYQSNQVLDVLENLKTKPTDLNHFSELKGAALFFRAFAFHQLLVNYAMNYAVSNASAMPGIPLRLKPEVDDVVKRASLTDSYAQVIADFKSAASLLPADGPLKARPYKGAAYGGLARTYLDMGMYEQAYLYADSALNVRADLLDYNSLNANASLPIARFNKEVLFHAITPSSYALAQGNAKIDSNLYRAYEQNDLRKKVFFKANTGANLGTYAFKGSYNNSASGMFVGLTTAEMYLIRAESSARLGKIAAALTDLNHLMKNRWLAGLYTDFSTTNKDALIAKILAERRKELLFRGLRWSDLKRLNLDERYKIQLKRIIDGKEYLLEPNSLKYALLIPQDAIEEGKLEQNKR